jgi:hypothetical protein
MRQTLVRRLSRDSSVCICGPSHNDRARCGLVVHEWEQPLKPSVPRNYFQPLDFRVNRAGDVGLLSGAGSGSFDKPEFSSRPADRRYAASRVVRVRIDPASLLVLVWWADRIGSDKTKRVQI